MAEKASIEGEKKSSKKMIIIIAVVVLLLAGGAGGYFFFMQKPADAEHASAEDKDQHAEAGHKEEAKHEEIVEPEVYYDLPSPLLVNFPPGSTAKVIKISLTILTQGEASVAAMKKHEPMIRNNLLMAISSIGAEKAKTLEGKQELRGLMLTEIGKVMEKMAGKNTVKDVYFTDFVMQ